MSESPRTPPAAAPAFSPLYQQIKQAMLASLQAGEWRPLQAIPSEVELARRYQVSQGTVRKAIDEMAAENLLLRRQGKGTFVASHHEPQVGYRFLRLHPDAGTLQSEGRAQRRILACERTRASAPLARALHVRTGAALLHVRRLLSLGAAPTIFEDIWLPERLFKGLTADMLSRNQGPTYALFEQEFGVHTIRAEEHLRATLPDAQQAALLEVDCATPLLHVQRTSYTYNDAPVELRHALYRTDTHYYQNVLN